MKKIIATTSLMLSLAYLAVLPTSVRPQNPGRVYPDDRARDDGKLWLGWDQPKRQGYVLGYVNGQIRGYRDGCLAYENLVRPNFDIDRKNSPLQSCMSREPQYSEDVNYFEAQITTFYEQYPGDQSMPLSEIFRLLSDDRVQTPKEIHEKYHDR